MMETMIFFNVTLSTRICWSSVCNVHLQREECKLRRVSMLTRKRVWTLQERWNSSFLWVVQTNWFTPGLHLKENFCSPTIMECLNSHPEANWTFFHLSRQLETSRIVCINLGWLASVRITTMLFVAGKTVLMKISSRRGQWRYAPSREGKQQRRMV